MSAFINPSIAPSIGLSEEQAQLIDIAQSFCRDKSPIDQVRHLLADETGFDPKIWQEIADLGWLGIGVPEEFGGIGLGLGEVVPIVEQMGRTLMTLPFVSTVLAAQAILIGGTPEQKQKFLPALASGTAASLALCENNADWDLENISCTAVKTEQGLVLSGNKYLVTDAPLAELFIVSVLHDGKPSLVIVPRTALADTAMTREKVIDDTRRSYAINLDGVCLEDDAVMDIDKASEALAHIELAASLLLAAEMCGGAYSVIDYTLDYLKTRKQFGKLIGSYQSLKHTMVDAHMGYERARSHLYSAAFLFAQQGEGEIAVRMAKAEANEAFSFAADRAIQFHGGFGFTYDCDAQLYRRRAIWCSALHGDARYHRRKLADLML
ncbi:acyl-CoA/acyl-ACP dehydrogenase [Alphaproteobacteria bacterium]|nr:acyl-CoA/acyl-ACP dehydrogenase [Alphaproteobacteria bacterium]MDC0131785.1 acyl-CoA/acyl-ACP dehydrogenase [Alphaproteobacteria bacterium]